MHSAMIAGLSLLFALACQASAVFSLSTQIAMLSVAVLVLGLPHGGLDHWTGRQLVARGYLPNMAMFAFLYLLIVAVVVAGWYLLPLATILVFFALSAWHFGLEEQEPAWVANRPTVANWLGLVARGGMVIWVPMLFQPAAVESLLIRIVPAGSIMTSSHIVTAIRCLAPLLLVFACWDIISLYLATAESTGSTAVARRAGVARIAAFAVLFATAPPLISFGVYFCGWHSIRGLLHLRDEFQLSASGLFRSLLPITVLAILCFLGGFVYWQTVQSLSDAALRTVFIGLSAVAVPHLLLHILADGVCISPLARVQPTTGATL